MSTIEDNSNIESECASILQVVYISTVAGKIHVDCSSLRLLSSSGLSVDRSHSKLDQAPLVLNVSTIDRYLSIEIYMYVSFTCRPIELARGRWLSPLEIRRSQRKRSINCKQAAAESFIVIAGIGTKYAHFSFLHWYFWISATLFSISAISVEHFCH